MASPALTREALRDAQPFETPGRLGRDRRFALRDDVPGRIQDDELLRRIRGDDRRRLDRDHARLQREPDSARCDERSQKAEPNPFSAPATHDGCEASIDAKLRQIGGGIFGHERRAKKERR
jgi:hypothetical protein